MPKTLMRTTMALLGTSEGETAGAGSAYDPWTTRFGHQNVLMIYMMDQQKIFSKINNARSKRGDPRKSKRIEDLLRRARNKGHLFKYA